jgi:hypothetical protein
MTGSINSNMFNRKRRLVKLEDIQLSQNQLEELTRFKAVRSLHWSVDYLRLLRRIGGGVCCICNELPSKLATYKVGNALMIERYCDNCISHIYDNLDGIDEKMIIEYR